MVRAARRLHISQPPLTRRIHGLEEELGAALFLRTPRGMELTDAGRALLPRVRGILLEVARLPAQVRPADAPTPPEGATPPEDETPPPPARGDGSR